MAEGPQRAISGATRLLELVFYIYITFIDFLQNKYILIAKLNIQ